MQQQRQAFLDLEYVKNQHPYFNGHLTKWFDFMQPGIILVAKTDPDETEAANGWEGKKWAGKDAWDNL